MTRDQPAGDGDRRSRRRLGLPRFVAASALVTMVSMAGGLAPATAGAAGTAAPTTPAGPATNGGANTDFQFSAQPYAAPGAQQRSFFSYELLPGHKILDQVAVLNKSSTDESFIAYPEDATNVPGTGGYAFQSKDKVHNTTVGTWLTLGQTSFTVPAGKEVIETFQLSIPADAPPGDHVGAVVIEELHGANQQQSPVGVNLVLRFAVPMYVHVVGKLHPGLTIEDLTVFHESPAFPYFSGSARTAVRFNVVNTGNDILDPKSVTVSITALIGGTIHTYTVHQTGGTQSKSNPLPVQMLPGGKLQLTEEWSGIPPFVPLTAHVSVDAVDPTTSLHHSTTTTSMFWYFPWILALIILALIAAIVARFTVIRRWRRRRDERRSDSGGGDPPPDPDGGRPVDPPPDSHSLEEVGV